MPAGGLPGSGSLLALIEFQDVTKVFSAPGRADVTAVVDLSLQIRAGETCCLIGPSGCGKTTTMKMVNRLIEPSRGRVLLEGQDVSAADPIELRRRIGYVMQSGGLFPHMTVARNIGLLCELEQWSRPATENRVHELLELVNLAPAEFTGRYPGELSGGQRQRVGVARALALDPAYILMDEPFGALDPITRAQIHREFLQLERQVAKTIVLVTHDMAEAFKLGDRVALMDAGELVQAGTEEELRARPASPFVTAFVDGNSAADAAPGGGV